MPSSLIALYYYRPWLEKKRCYLIHRGRSRERWRNSGEKSWLAGKKFIAGNPCLRFSGDGTPINFSQRVTH